MLVVALDPDHPAKQLVLQVQQSNQRQVREQLASLDYRRPWAGYGIAEGTFRWNNSPTEFRLIAQREGEARGDYQYKAFITTSGQPALELLTHLYGQRWSIEEFFNFEGDMGWNRAGTFNLNIRYGKASLALMAQAAAYNLRRHLPGPYRNWTAGSLAQKALTNKGRCGWPGTRSPSPTTAIMSR